MATKLTFIRDLSDDEISLLKNFNELHKALIAIKEHANKLALENPGFRTLRDFIEDQTAFLQTIRSDDTTQSQLG